MREDLQQHGGIAGENLSALSAAATHADVDKHYRKGLEMKIREVIGGDAEKLAADNLKNNAKRMQQQASAAQARLKVKKAQQQLTKAVQPITPK